MTGLIALVALGWAGQDVSDDQIIAMGRDAWIARHQGADLDQLRSAERRFALAVGLRKEAAIQRSADAKLLNDIDIDMANITKGACRLADYQLAQRPEGLLINAKASTLMVLTMDAVVRRLPCASAVTQTDVWRTYKDTAAYHLGQSEAIQRDADRGGYSVEGHALNYKGLGHNIGRLMNHVASRSADEKRHLFDAVIKLIYLTKGQDPLS